MQTKGVDELLKETQELVGGFHLVGRRRLALAEAGSDRLLYPHDVCEVYPGPGILDWAVGAVLWMRV